MNDPERLLIPILLGVMVGLVSCGFYILRDKPYVTIEDQQVLSEVLYPRAIRQSSYYSENRDGWGVGVVLSSKHSIERIVRYYQELEAKGWAVESVVAEPGNDFEGAMINLFRDSLLALVTVAWEDNHSEIVVLYGMKTKGDL